MRTGALGPAAVAVRPERAYPHAMDSRRLDHERLRVYSAALDCLEQASDMVATLPRGHGYIADQLRRAAISICLNIAEGAGEFAPSEKARFYRMARRSATECSAVLDICARLRLPPTSAAKLAAGRTLLIDIVSILTALAKAHDG